jgi:hypothetical protein
MVQRSVSGGHERNSGWYTHRDPPLTAVAPCCVACRYAKSQAECAFCEAVLSASQIEGKKTPWFQKVDAQSNAPHLWHWTETG